MTFTLKIVNHFLRKTDRHMIIHHHCKFGKKIKKNGLVVQKLSNGHNRTHGQNYRRTEERRTDGQSDSNIPPFFFWGGGGGIKIYSGSGCMMHLVATTFPICFFLVFFCLIDHFICTSRYESLPQP